MDINTEIPNEVLSYTEGLVYELQDRIEDTLVIEHDTVEYFEDVFFLTFTVRDGENQLGELIISQSYQTTKNNWQCTYKGLIHGYNNGHLIVMAATNDRYEAEKQFVYPDTTLTNILSSFRLDGYADIGFATGNELHPIPQRQPGLFDTEDPRRIAHLLKEGSDLERSLKSYVNTQDGKPRSSGSGTTLDITIKKD